MYWGFGHPTNPVYSLGVSGPPSTGDLVAIDLAPLEDSPSRFASILPGYFGKGGGAVRTDYSCTGGHHPTLSPPARTRHLGDSLIQFFCTNSRCDQRSLPS